MHSAIVGLTTGVIMATASFVAATVEGVKHVDLANTLSIVIPVSGFGWYLSARLTRIEDAVKNLDCMRCPPKKKQKE